MDAAFDLGGGFNPAKGLSVVVPVGEVAGDGPFQTADAVKAAAADGLTSNQGKPAFDQIEPRGAGRSEVQMDAPVDRSAPRNTCQRSAGRHGAPRHQRSGSLKFGSRISF